MESKIIKEQILELQTDAYQIQQYLNKLNELNDNLNNINSLAHIHTRGFSPHMYHLQHNVYGDEIHELLNNFKDKLSVCLKNRISELSIQQNEIKQNINKLNKQLW